MNAVWFSDPVIRGLTFPNTSRSSSTGHLQKSKFPIDTNTNVNLSLGTCRQKYKFPMNTNTNINLQLGSYRNHNCKYKYKYKDISWALHQQRYILFIKTKKNHVQSFPSPGVLRIIPKLMKFSRINGQPTIGFEIHQLHWHNWIM